MPFPSPEDLDPGIEFASPALATGFFTPEPPAEALSPSQNKTKPQTREPKAQRGEEGAQPPAGAIQSGRCRDRDGHRWAFKSSPVTLRPCSPQCDPATTANAGSSFSGGHLQLAECCHETEGTSLQSHGAGTCLGAMLVMARPGAPPSWRRRTRAPTPLGTAAPHRPRAACSHAHCPDSAGQTQGTEEDPRCLHCRLLTQAALEDRPGVGVGASAAVSQDWQIAMQKEHLPSSQTEKAMRTIFILEKNKTWDEPQQRAKPRTPGGSEGQRGCARGLGTAPLGHSTDPGPSDPHPAW